MNDTNKHSPLPGLDPESLLAMTYRANDGNMLKTAAALAKETARLLAERDEAVAALRELHNAFGPDIEKRRAEARAFLSRLEDRK